MQLNTNTNVFDPKPVQIPPEATHFSFFHLPQVSFFLSFHLTLSCTMRALEVDCHIICNHLVTLYM